MTRRMREAEELTAIEAEKARRRQLAGLKQGDGVPVVEIFPQREKGKTRDKVAESVGFGSGRSYEKAVKVWATAKEKRVCTRCAVARSDASNG